MVLAILGIAGFLAQYILIADAVSTMASWPSQSEEALAELRQGNHRFVNSARTLSTDTIHDSENRLQLATSQHPFAAVVCCSDSRVCPEFVFDQRAGSIFEIRNAGNVICDDVLASLEYAVEHLHVPLIVILGHKGCGAIEAVVEAGDEPLPGHLQELQAHMESVREELPHDADPHNRPLIDRLCLANAKQQALEVVHGGALLEKELKKWKTKVVYAIYDMETGEVEFFEDF